MILEKILEIDPNNRSQHMYIYIHIQKRFSQFPRVTSFSKAVKLEACPRRERPGRKLTRYLRRQCVEVRAKPGPFRVPRQSMLLNNLSSDLSRNR